ncbi:MAG: hypothetical protein ACQRW7_02940, partial [Caulobacterales bacterium]|uniref:hypothetical protein n=1 Tax=Glycocaulis sp. TaxID=1969725 RepID=UPI003F9F7271
WGYSHFNSTAAAIGVGTATAGTALALNEINNSLESALGSLAGQALATTTVDPGFGYGGRAVAQPFDEEMMIDPRVELHVDVGGEIHMFAFTLAEGAANLIPYNSGLSTGGAVGTDTAGK